MLFSERFWAGLADGSVTVAFRRWRKPRAKVGSRHHVPGGMIAIDEVAVTTADAITEADTRRAGYTDRDELLAELARHDGELYRVELHWAGPDPRVALRESAALTGEERAGLVGRLDRYDRAAPRGPWTRDTLRAIAQRPATRAADLAAGLGRDTNSFKIDVRKLKALGLTESLEVGYRLSPRGQALLDGLEG